MTPARPMRPAGPAVPAWPAVLIMAKAPRPGMVKTRLHPMLGPDGCAALAERLICHTVSVATAVGEATVFTAVDPPDALDEMGGLMPGCVTLLRQRGADLGERLAAAAGELFAGGHWPVVVIGTDAPTLTAGRLAEAFGELARGRDVVFGPACDGGYYLVGLNRPAPELFALDPGVWGGDRVLAASLAAACRAGLDAGLLPALRDLDTPADAQVLLGDPLLPSAIAAALRSPARPAAGCHEHDGTSGGVSVSIVVPVLNEAAAITTGLARLRHDLPGCELVVADGGSTDGTAELAAPLARVIRCESGRAAQMNAGARHASGEVLWFIHADTRVDPGALGQIAEALADPATVGGGLTLRFDQSSFALRYVAWTSNLRARFLHWVFGDQAMFIRRSVFDALGGFPGLPLMEDLEMSRRLRRTGRLAVLPATATTSARRFTEHGTWRTLAFMQYLKLLYFLGADPQRISDRYQAGPPRLASPRQRRSIPAQLPQPGHARPGMDAPRAPAADPLRPRRPGNR
ncbi:MAG: TIGR04283 family arsenosugar biosynthesis glycosyltransferase [Streptosporangiaceae bacterium]